MLVERGREPECGPLGNVARRGEQEPRRRRLVDRAPSVAGGEDPGCARPSEADGGGGRGSPARCVSWTGRLAGQVGSQE